MPTCEDLQIANSHIRGELSPTPLTLAPQVSEIFEKEIYFKWDNKLKTGSFKERGVINFLTQLPDKLRKKGVCAASAGNHALALSYHSSRFQIPCSIVMPRQAPLVKVDSTKKFGASVDLQGESFGEAREYAIELAKRESLTLVPAFDHPAIIAGQSTAGLELLEQLEDLDALVVPVGGAGLISGMALAVKEAKPDTFILGVRTKWAETKHSADKRDLIPEISLADGIAVKQIGELTGRIVEQKVDKIITVDERSISEAIVQFLELERTVVEGAGAAGLAGLYAEEIPKDCKKIAVMVTGSNIDINVLSRLIEQDMAQRGRMLRFTVSAADRPGLLSTASSIISNQGGNVLEVFHNRSFSSIPGSVDITFVVETRDQKHGKQILISLENAGAAISA